MNINDLIAIVKKKLINEIKIEKIEVEDKSFLHKNHSEPSRGKVSFKTKNQLKRAKRFK
jgi:BolA protein